MKVDRSILMRNDQNMGDIGDPDKLENSIEHLADTIDKNENVTAALVEENEINKNKIDNLQNQVDQISKEGDSSLEAAQARVTETGKVYSTLQERLNDGDVQLAKKVEKGELVINAKDFGAVGNHVSDDSVAILAAINKAVEGQTVIVPEGVYRTTQPIVVSKNINLIILGVIIADHPGTAIEFKDLGRGTSINCSHRVSVKRAVVDHANETSVGVKVNGCYNQKFLINLIKDFNYGLKLEAELGKGCVYNEFELMSLSNNKKQIHLNGYNNGPTDPEKSWPNQNTFIAGRLNWTSAATRTDFVGIQIGNSASEYICNGNVFINTSIEDVGAGGVYATPIRCFGHSNVFIAPRTEGGLNYVFEASSFNNKVIGGFYTTLKNVTDTGERNEFDFARGGLRKWALNNDEGNIFAASGAGVHAAKFYNRSSSNNPILAIYESDGKTLAAYMTATGEMQWRSNVKHVYNQLNAAPTTGTWQRNDVVWRNNPAPGQYIGWVCTAGGTPGTWKGFGMIEA